jgi:IS1 family transposase
MFEGIEKKSRKCFLVKVPNRSTATLAPIIEKHVLSESRIITDSWLAYDSIPDTVIHQQNLCGN